MPRITVKPLRWPDNHHAVGYTLPDTSWCSLANVHGTVAEAEAEADRFRTLFAEGSTDLYRAWAHLVSQPEADTEARAIILRRFAQVMMGNLIDSVVEGDALRMAREAEKEATNADAR